MKWFSILVSFVVLSSAAVMGAEPQPDEVEKEVKRLEGTWKLTSLRNRFSERNGSRENRDYAEDETSGKRELTIKGNQWTEKRIGKETSRTAEFVVDPSKSPKTLELTYTVGNGKSYTDHRLYILEGDTLKVLSSVRGFNGRPEHWQDMHTFLYVWERVKK